jgi:hypothetical protein
MKPYKEILLKKLVNEGWELHRRDDHSDWWADEHWKIKSVVQNWGLKVFIHFLVDPQYEGTKKSSAVWAISATHSMPRDRIEAEQGIALMPLSKGKFDKNSSQGPSGFGSFLLA